MEIEASAQRSRRHHAPVAQATRAVDNGNRKGLGEGWVLQPVIHHDDITRAAARFDESGAGCTITCDHDWPACRMQQGFIAHVACGIESRVDPMGAWEASTIAPSQNDRRAPELTQQVCDRGRNRCFPRTPSGKIADADDGQRRSIGCRAMPATLRDARPDARNRGEQTGLGRPGGAIPPRRLLKVHEWRPRQAAERAAGER